MAKVSMLGTIQCQPGRSNEMEAVLITMVDATKNEPGTEVYSYHRGDKDTFWFFALMTNEEAMNQHGQGPEMKAAMKALGPLMAAPPQISLTTPVAAIGLDL